MKSQQQYPRSQGEAQPVDEYAWENGTIGDGLDRLETLVGRIGMNTPERAQAVLNGLSVLFPRIEALENLATRKPLDVQFQAILARLEKEASQFIRDLGGLAALQTLRAASQPPADHTWWYLDQWLDQRRQASRVKMLRMLAGLVIGFALLTLLYQLFLAPDPALVAMMEHEQNSRDALMSGNYVEVLAQAEQGLQYDAANLELLVLKGVALQAAGRTDEAELVFDQARATAESEEDYLLNRGQAYLQANLLDAALADIQTVQAINPESPSAFLLSGQVYEARSEYLQAYNDYDKASSLANAQDQVELAAIARTRLAYLIQIMNAPQNFPTVSAP